MTKGYWIATVTVTDAEQYQRYQVLARDVLTQYGAKPIVRSDDIHVMESRDGKNAERCVILEFTSLESALKCYHSAAYQEAREARRNAAVVDITIVSGLENSSTHNP
ncbi:DUF1330 domain-containing protein [Salinicola salarius]|uniref:DUF1330 domain-containing protein n=1 Tax=Salinicola salarius TaxID=430457 RepID=UPI0023E46234|nr:DUF1330 domain-containing protein [Salinicola salarius]MDF3918109.1 DUF1330 domain-containing protein [Salinicola salarius]